MDECTFSFIICIIHACADRWDVSSACVYQALKKSGCLHQYLILNYDILYAQSTDYVVHDIEEYLKGRESQHDCIPWLRCYS